MGWASWASSPYAAVLIPHLDLINIIVLNYTSVCIVYTYIHMYIHTYIHMNTYTYLCIYVYTYICRGQPERQWCGSDPTEGLRMGGATGCSY